MSPCRRTLVARLSCLAVGLSLTAVGCRAPDPMHVHLKRKYEPEGYEIADLMDRYEAVVDSKWQLDPVAEHPEATVCVSQVKGDIPLHYFKRHHRVICVLSGKGIAKVGGTNYRVSPGATFIVPKGARYSYTNEGAGKYFAICTFCPQYSGKDIKYVKPGKK